MAHAARSHANYMVCNFCFNSKKPREEKNVLLLSDSFNLMNMISFYRIGTELLVSPPRNLVEAIYFGAHTLSCRCCCCYWHRHKLVMSLPVLCIANCDVIGLLLLLISIPIETRLQIQLNSFTMGMIYSHWH